MTCARWLATRPSDWLDIKASVPIFGPDSRVLVTQSLNVSKELQARCVMDIHPPHILARSRGGNPIKDSATLALSLSLALPESMSQTTDR